MLRNNYLKRMSLASENVSTNILYVLLRCELILFPPLSVDNGDPGVPQSGEDGFLNFTSIRREHSGWYKCTAHHRFGLFSSIGYFLNVRCEYLPFY
ncbi:hypothetical protein J437_LFUL007318 [Ladona fulva]|uniref:Uncharacterized protein n=1 Tax=Ladona fulva TaxID=123851 RepID=A0A8K0K733_LADFU|nr:hypothetical protein J437_LFUL007318 [Ladona fulva]